MFFKNTKENIIGQGILNALGAALYITLVATFITHIESIFGPMKGVLSVVAFLLVLVISVSIMGITIFLKPVLWYLDGNKKEAVKLLASTVVSLIVIVAVVFSALAFLV
jgi:hypothetical protein